MKKYLVVALVCLSSVSYAAEKGSASLGQRDQNSSLESCYSKIKTGCEPCEKACRESFGGDRSSSSDARSNAIKTNNKKGTATQQ